MSREQTQNSGDDSSNQQAGRDIVNYSGWTVADVREICQLVVKSELPAVSAQAAEIAVQRVSDFTETLVRRLEHLRVDNLDGFADPDVQFSLGDAQKSFARSGRDELKATLVELVIARSQLPTGEIQATAISQAIESVRLLTPGQIRALSFAWFVAETVGGHIISDEDFRQMSESVLGRLVADPLPSEAEIRHLGSTNCAILTSDTYILSALLANDYGAGLIREFEKSELPQTLTEKLPQLVETGVLVEAEQGRLRIGGYNSASTKTLRDNSGVDSETIEQVSKFQYETLYDKDSVESRLKEIHPVWTKIYEFWNKTSIDGIRCTPVGIVIAHSYVQDISQTEIDLDHWLPKIV